MKSKAETKRDLLQKRHEIFKTIRHFFEKLDFIEIHTPLLVPNPGLEPQLVPFETEYLPAMGGGKKQTLYLPTSPEYHLKKALALGFPKIFEITRSFRNGEMSAEHEPEFFIMEWYRQPGTYEEIADDFEALLCKLGQKFDPRAPWPKRQDITVTEAFSKFAKVDLEAALSKGPSLTEQCRAQNHASVRAEDDFDTSFHKILVEKIEPQLGFEGPCFLWDYPVAQASMARVKKDEPLFCERFECYWKSIELCNAFGELTDSNVQRNRCLKDQEQRLNLHGKTPPLDTEFLEALKELKGPVGGIAVGLDRLVQCLLGQEKLQDVVAFPHRNSL